MNNETVTIVVDMVKIVQEYGNEKFPNFKNAEDEATKAYYAGKLNASSEILLLLVNYLKSKGIK